MVVAKAEESIGFQTPEDLEALVKAASTEELVEIILSQENSFLECGIAFGERFDQFNLLSKVDCYQFLSDAIEQMEPEDLLLTLENYLF